MTTEKIITCPNYNGWNEKTGVHGRNGIKLVLWALMVKSTGR